MKTKNLVLPVIVLIAIVGIFAYVSFNSGKTSPPSSSSIIVKNSGGSAMLSAECGDKSYLNDEADVIVIVNVERIETRQEDQIYTYSITNVESIEKGNLGSDLLTIKTPGGCIGTTCTAVEDGPIFHENKSVRIYLKQTGNEFSIICGIMGVEELRI